VGNGYAESTARQVGNDPTAMEAQPLRVAIKPAPGQSEVVLYLASQDVLAGGGQVLWHRPRFEAAGKPPLLLRDYAQFGPAFEVDYPSVFAGSAKYLAAAVEAVNDRQSTLDDLAKKHGLDAPFLKRWIEVLAVESLEKGAEPKTAPAVALELLEEKKPKDDRGRAEIGRGAGRGMGRTGR